MRRSKQIEIRQRQAIERNEKWAALSFEQQIKSLDDRGLTATKQRARIATAIVKRDSTPKPEPVAKAEEPKKKKQKQNNKEIRRQKRKGH